MILNSRNYIFLMSKHKKESISSYEENPRSIKYHIKRFLLKNKKNLEGKTIVDFPAGNGITSRIIKEIGGKAVPLDLFPEYFAIENLVCERANIAEGLPLLENSADMVICQEGIEHFSDQMHAFKEFNRVLKPGGALIVTTPNYSSLRSKMSYLLSESERFNSIMPPNELDSIWMADSKITKEIYYGHIFLIGIQKLRVFGKLTGFKIKKIHFIRLKTTSLLLFPIFYPFILLSNYFTYKRNLRKNKNFDKETVAKAYKEIFNLSVNPKILLDGHLMVEYEKEMHFDNVSKTLRGKHKEFGIT